MWRYLLWLNLVNKQLKVAFLLLMCLFELAEIFMPDALLATILPMCPGLGLALGVHWLVQSPIHPAVLLVQPHPSIFQSVQTETLTSVFVFSSYLKIFESYTNTSVKMWHCQASSCYLAEHLCICSSSIKCNHQGRV